MLKGITTTPKVERPSTDIPFTNEPTKRNLIRLIETIASQLLFKPLNFDNKERIIIELNYRIKESLGRFRNISRLHEILLDSYITFIRVGRKDSYYIEIQITFKDDPNIITIITLS